jgi:RHO1 GDP-GTP exchange protein 1/2
VFWNIYDIIAVNTRLRDALNKRQKSYAVVERIGDILLDAVPHFGPFVTYGAHQLYGKYEFEKEKSSNPAFASFVEVCCLFDFAWRMWLLTRNSRQQNGCLNHASWS